MARTIHVIGAGLSGLSAAIRLTERGERVIVHEAMQQAGGRARSYYDASTDLVIDNGNHLLLSGNHAAMSYVRTLGSQAGLIGPPRADFAFIDLPSKQRWTLRINDGRLPWWMLDGKRRVPGSTLADYLRLLPLVLASRDKTVGETIACKGPVYDRLAHPLLLAALNIDPPQGSAALAGAIMRETLMAGGAACRPLIARGLTEVLIDPALRLLAQRGAQVRFGAQLRALDLRDGRVQALDLGENRIVLREGDAAILAVPPWIAPSLVPGLPAPSQYRAIVNAHFRIAPPKDFPPMIGVLGGTVEWIFAFPDRLSVTISGADRLLDRSREDLASTIWSEVAQVAGIAADLPPWQVVRERRATFAATPAEDAKRPGPATKFANLYLAGDWTDTGLPATIEGAIRSGNRAADLALRL
ncbi:MAG: FAD-binding protein [Alphaproteobacteria bacterium]|nr:MAG: FAD-binding protein [Alphaproteobacteria bacterium]